MSQFTHVGTPAATHRGHIRCGGAAYRPPHPTRVILVLAAFAGSAWLVSCGDSAVGPAPPPPNRAPVPAGSIPAQTVAVGETAAVDVSAYFSDPDGDALSYTAETSDAGVAEVSVSGSTVTVSAVGRGSATVMVTATDPGGLTATQTLEATVPNRAPEARGSLPDQTVQAGQTATLDVSPYFTDADGDALSYAASSSNPSVAVVSTSGATVMITAVAKGSVTVMVTATDPGGLTATQTLEATVPNRAPEVRGSLPDQTVQAGQTATLDVSPYFTDADGDALSYAASSSNPSVAVVSTSGATVMITAVAKGSVTVMVTATDPGGLTATQTLEATVPNRAPEVRGSLPDQTVQAGQTATLDVSPYFTDADGDALSYAASSSNPSVAVVSTSGATVMITAVAKGSVTVMVTATDPGGLTATQTLEATVVPNRAPEARGSLPDQTVQAGQTATLDVSPYFTDADGDALSYAASSSNPSVAVVSTSGATVMITAVAKGSVTVMVTATDPGGLTATQTLEATVPNRAPEVRGSLPDQTVQAGQTATLDVSPYFTDADGDALSYAASSSNPSVAVVSTSGATVMITAVAKGSVTVMVTATDPGGLTATQTLEATVPNRAPEVRGSLPDQTVQAGQTATLDVSPYFTDADGDALSYAASSSNPSVAVVSTSGATVMITAVAKGSVTVMVTATDPGGLTATQTLEATVPNRAPEVRGSLPDQTVQAGQTATLDVSPYFTDADGDALSYAAAMSSSSVSTASVSGAVVTLQGVAAGGTTLTVTARDPDGGAATQQASVTVIPPAPDLAFAGVSPASATLSPGSPATFAFRIRNQGTLASSATTIRAMRSPNPIVSTRDTELKSYSLSSLAASQDLTFPLTISVDASSAAGTIYIGMCIDAVTDESNTRNNCSEGARLTITASSSGQQPSGSVSAGDGSAIRIRASHPRIEASSGDL